MEQHLKFILGLLLYGLRGADVCRFDLNLPRLLLSRSTAASFYVPLVTQDTLDLIALEKGMNFQAGWLALFLLIQCERVYELTHSSYLGMSIETQEYRGLLGNSQIWHCNFDYESLQSFSQT